MSSRSRMRSNVLASRLPSSRAPRPISMVMSTLSAVRRISPVDVPRSRLGGMVPYSLYTPLESSEGRWKPSLQVLQGGNIWQFYVHWDLLLSVSWYLASRSISENLTLFSWKPFNTTSVSSTVASKNVKSICGTRRGSMGFRPRWGSPVSMYFVNSSMTLKFEVFKSGNKKIFTFWNNRLDYFPRQDIAAEQRLGQSRLILPQLRGEKWRGGGGETSLDDIRVVLWLLAKLYCLPSMTMLLGKPVRTFCEILC